ncbi:glycoside hydrolase family 32 protein [Lactobacillus xylocopicola]|uniref:beta-fructofuranosidase n=1 Tax=Lactobacillus xylocopicola TaxID=2976676 RepID=A0ABN6SNU3_9LACO|nr:hypothetical protein [Lactobacillus xylocopicola]BDR60966.1 glycosyl hydrolase [Lactobacillus xylocopicola]
MKLIEQANQTLQVKNPFRYKYHLAPNSGWSNDPNGLVFFKGYYHVFMQNDPFSTYAKHIFWAHFISRDLIKWQQVDFALAPDQPYDADGCFSGSALVVENKLVLAYAGHKKKKSTYQETICLAESVDGINFKKFAGNPLILRNPNVNTKRFRDPKILEMDGLYFILVGGESKDGRGQLLFYSSDNLYKDWHYFLKMINQSADFGNMIECPDYFSCGVEKIIIGSPKGINTSEKKGFDSLYYMGDANRNNLPFGKKIDNGWDFYAPQTMYDPLKNRRILIGWLGLPIEQEKERKYGYPNIGALTIPREIKIKDDYILAKPIVEYKKLRKKKIEIVKLSQYSSTSEFFFEKLPNVFSLKLFTSKAKYIVKYQNKILTVTINDKLRKHVEKIEDIHEVINIDLYIDNGLTELFVNNGKFTFTNKCEFSTDTIKVNFISSDKMVGFNYELESIFE